MKRKTQSSRMNSTSCRSLTTKSWLIQTTVVELTTVVCAWESNPFYCGQLGTVNIGSRITYRRWWQRGGGGGAPPPKVRRYTQSWHRPVDLVRPSPDGDQTPTFSHLDLHGAILKSKLKIKLNVHSSLHQCIECATS
jgi:hypothetical protein